MANHVSVKAVRDKILRSPIQNKWKHFVVPKPPLKSLDDAAGLLRSRYSDLKRHYQKIRQEWPAYKRS